MSTDKKNTADKTKTIQKPSSGLVFGRMNYILTAASLVILIIGFVLMAGKTDIYNSTKTSVAPVVVIIGFLVGMLAIFYREKSSGE